MLFLTPLLPTPPGTSLYALQEAQAGFSMKEWVDAVVTAAGGKIVEESEEVIKAVAEGDAGAEKFPLKMRDAAQVGGQQRGPWFPVVACNADSVQ
jgi:hypothetical protein